MNRLYTKEDEIVEEFTLLEGDLEMTLNYLMELGEKLEPYPEDKRDEAHLVKGCQSKVWLDIVRKEDGTLKILADSNTAITKGLVSLLLRLYSGEKPEIILNSPISFPEKIGMSRFIGTQRSNGFAAMMKQIKIYALAFSSASSPN